jgi:putative ABC transport system substrate-binding protein
MNKKWLTIGMIIFGMLLLVSACGKSEKPETTGGSSEGTISGETAVNKKYKIGVTQIVEHPSLNAAYDGFKKAIEDSGLNVEFEVQNAQNDNSINMTIANNLVNSGVDLIFANSTPSAQAVAGVTSDIPIIFTSVTDAVSAELVQSVESPGGNVTGTIDNQPKALLSS